MSGVQAKICIIFIGHKAIMAVEVLITAEAVSFVGKHEVGVGQGNDNRRLLDVANELGHVFLDVNLDASVEKH